MSAHMSAHMNAFPVCPKGSPTSLALACETIHKEMLLHETKAKIRLNINFFPFYFNLVLKYLSGLVTHSLETCV